jgi:hypothetical protein
MAGGIGPIRQSGHTGGRRSSFAAEKPWIRNSQRYTYMDSGRLSQNWTIKKKLSSQAFLEDDDFNTNVFPQKLDSAIT